MAHHTQAVVPSIDLTHVVLLPLQMHIVKPLVRATEPVLAAEQATGCDEFILSFAYPLISSVAEGLVEPIPTFPESLITIAVFSVPPLVTLSKICPESLVLLVCAVTPAKTLLATVAAEL